MYFIVLRSTLVAGPDDPELAPPRVRPDVVHVATRSGPASCMIAREESWK